MNIPLRIPWNVLPSKSSVTFFYKYVWWGNIAWLSLRCTLLFANVLLVSSLETAKIIFQPILLWNILVLYFV